MSKVMVLGSGGREHALVAALADSAAVSSVFVAPGNAGTSNIDKVTNITALNLKDHQAVISKCQQENVTVVVVGPEDPLADGLADSLNAAGIKVFGPSKGAAQIESSKAWAKDFMQRHGIPTARYQTFSDPQKAKDYIQSESWAGYVVKASGLAAGKGVVVTDSRASALEAVDTVSGSFGSAGDTLVIEELLRGEEVSVLCFTDGKTVAVMPPAQDHKRLQEGDQGPNTGGMGAYCPCPLVSQSQLKSIEEKILQKAIDGLRSEGIPFVGVLYAGLMLTSSGPQVLEFNCRFGDPETQVLLPLLRTDLYDIVMACVGGTLSQCVVEFDDNNCCVAVCVVSGGYPGSYPKGKKITGVEEVEKENGVVVYQAGTKMEGSDLATAGGRVLAVTVIDSTLAAAATKATAAASRISFEGAFFRRDIASKAFNRSRAALEVTYKGSGVDIAAGDALVSAIKDVAASTKRSGVMGGLGSFGGIFDMKATGYKDPLLISGTDGVGTKLKVAQSAGIHNTVGQDLVAMCVNDVLVHGAEPLFFLDYFATGKLEVGVASSVVKGVAEGCLLAGCALIGGETAEMPGMYSPGEYDLAGFTVGAVERAKLLPLKDSISPGDILLGVEASGLHSNGFSLVRRIVEANDLKYADPAPFSPGNTLGSELLKPTKIYVRSLLPALQSGLVKAAAHITGGGLTENLPRVLPDHLSVSLQADKWNMQPVFHWLSANGVSSKEMSKTFNCGLGMVLVVGAKDVEKVQQLIMNDTAKVVGSVRPNQEGVPRVLIQGLGEALSQGALSPRASSLTLRTQQRKRVAVLISGSGTNLQALLDHTQSGLSSAEIVLVISNVAGVKGLERAMDAGVPTQVIPHKNYKNRQEFDAALTEALKSAQVELVCLAGFMRILTGDFVRTWTGRLLNIHPSLLPSFKGMHAQRQALQAGVSITGCTVHFVAEEVDGGAIVTQEAVPVLPGDTEDVLSERIKTAEHRAFPRAMELVARGRVKLDNEGRCIRL